MNGHGIVILAFFIIASKFIVSTFQKFKIPPVIGLIALGLICGNSGFNFLHEEGARHAVELFAEIGVVLLMFLVGLETDLLQLKSMGKRSLYIAIAGVFIPFIAGFLLAYAFTGQFERSIILGSILTATSVSISVLTFSDLKKLNSVEARTVITSAIIDDVIAIIFLSVILGLIGVNEQSPLLTVGIIVGYFIGAVLFGVTVVPFLIRFSEKSIIRNFSLAVSLGLVLIYSWVAHLIELASITGAYVCGIIIGIYKDKEEIIHDVETIGESLFIPIFFITVGLNINLDTKYFTAAFALFTVVFIIVAIVSKIVGCGGVARMLGFNNTRSFIIGSGMVPRGEVALVIVSIASTGGRNILQEMDKASVIFLVLVTAVLTPILIKYGFDRTQIDRRKKIRRKGVA